MRSFWSAILLVFVLGAVIPGAGAASDPEQAKSFIRDLADRTLAVLADDTMDSAARERRLSELFAAGFHLPTISKFVLGKHWRQATDDQRATYLKVFQEFIVKTYSRRFTTFSGEQLDIIDGRIESDGDISVLTRIVRPSGPSTRVSWRVREVGDHLQIVDVVVEGVSMLITHRDEMNSVMRAHGGSVDGLIGALKEKIASYN